MPLPELITDRTAEDYARALELSAIRWQDMTPEQQAEWQTSLKGAYNASDLNRVTEAVEYLVGRLRSFGYAVEYTAVTVSGSRTEWTEDDIPTASQLAQYLANVKAVRDAIENQAPEPPADMVGLTYEEANDIEQILVDIETTIDQVVRSMARSNAFTFWSGNRPFPSEESYLGRTWAELDAMNTTWANWQVATWYLLLYGNLQAEGEVT